MGLKPLDEYPIDKPCMLCGRFDDLPDEDYCSACCYALAMASESDLYPDIVDNLKGWVAQKLGIGTLPAMSIMMTEMWMSYLLHHPVILPTPIGHDLMGMVVRQALIARKMTVSGGAKAIRFLSRAGRESRTLT